MKRKKATTAKTKTSPKKKATKAVKPVASKPRLALQDFVMESLSADKAQNAVMIDLRGKTAIADYMVVATGTSSRHVGAMAQRLAEKLKSELKIPARLEGVATGDWVIVDAGDVMVHLFREEVRSFYNLEKLWGSDFSTANYTRYQNI